MRTQELCEYLPEHSHVKSILEVTAAWAAHPDSGPNKFTPVSSLSTLTVR